MKWVILVIIAVLVPYTYINLKYRKPNPAYRPYQDAQERANVVRLLSAGYKRITLKAELPADPFRAVAPVATTAVAGGLPAALVSTLVEKPLLPAEIRSVTTASSLIAANPYPIRFLCVLPDNKEQLAGAELYLKDNEIVITPDFELLTGGLQARSRESEILLTVPGGSFKPGAYTITLVGERASRTWTLQVH
jgi:hypothetical protein